MPAHRKQLKRIEVVGGRRYLTFSCHRKLRLLGNPEIRDLLVRYLASARDRCGFRLIAWVIMPNHVHLIIIPLAEDWPVDRILVAIKEPLARVVIRRWRKLGAPILDRLAVSDGRTRFWQAGGGFDRNIRDGEELDREVEYIHNNPVRRGLVERPTDWAWSSARWYAGMKDGQAPIDSAWARTDGRPGI